MIKYSENYTLPKSFEAKQISKLKTELNVIKSELKNKFETDYASFNLPDDLESIKLVQKLSRSYSTYSTIVVIGIGGSNLGTQAVLEAYYGQNFNSKFFKKLYFLDTVDSDRINEVVSFLKTDIKNNKKILVNVVSKSGTTTETIAIFNIMWNLFKKSKQNLSKSFVFTTDLDSKLWCFGKEHQIPCLEIPKKVGGRYSVFSAVGLFPLAVYGLNINKLLKGAREMKKKCLRLVGNPALRSSLNIFDSYNKKCNIVETFVFKKDFEAIGKWYRQLMGESLGKQFDVNGKEVWKGITPTVAIGSVDLHSMAQLYLGGPKDKHINFIIPKESKQVSLSKIKEFDSLDPKLSGINMSSIMNSIIKGIQGALKKQKRPFTTLYLDSNLEDIGALLQMKMFEIVLLAKLLNVNPFDQPNVEEYKIITKKYIKKLKT